MRILVTGASGQLGQDVLEAAAAAGHEAVGFDRGELDVADAASVTSALQAARPDAVIHCAAYTAVDDAEEHFDEAMRINGIGSDVVAHACDEFGCYLVAVSTDYVFPGTHPDGYAEDDEVDPVNAYGATKLAGEVAVLAFPAHCLVRTAWLFGRRGTNFVRTIARLAAQRETIDVVDDQRGCPTYAGHLARALVECAERRLAGVLHLVDSPVATWYDLALEVVQQTGADCQVRRTTSAAFPRPAARPACSVLRVTRPDTPAMGDWREGVRHVASALREEEGSSALA